MRSLHIVYSEEMIALDQGTILGWHRICFADRTSGGEAITMATKQIGTEAADKAGISVTHGGIVH